MTARSVPTAAGETREQRVEAILEELRPKVDAVVRRLVERAVDVPEAEEFGPIDLSSSATRDKSWSTTSGKPAWRAGKKGVRRLQRHLPRLHLRGQVPLLPAAAAVDRA